jgi:DnaK suppressor protein
VNLVFARRASVYAPAHMTKRDETQEALTPGQLAELREMLTDKRAALTKSVTRRVGEARGDQPDPMDAATDATGDDENVLLNERDRVAVREIDAALARMDDGTYGLSEDSGDPIGFARLKIVPMARLTVQEAEELERRGR